MAEPDQLALIEQVNRLMATATGLVDGKAHPVPRSGPLQVVGRFYISLTTILALAGSASAFFDWKMALVRLAQTPAVGKALEAESLHESTYSLRHVLVAVVLVGIGMAILLVVWLTSRHPYLLSSPTELSQGTQEALRQLPQKGRGGHTE